MPHLSLDPTFRKDLPEAAQRFNQSICNETLRQLMDADARVKGGETDAAQQTENELLQAQYAAFIWTLRVVIDAGERRAKLAARYAALLTQEAEAHRRQAAA